MKVISKIALQIDDYRKISSVSVMQCDSNTRVLEIHLYASGVEWPVPDGVEVSVAYRKADHTSGWYDKLPNGDAACSVSGNVVTAILAPQVLTAAGRCHVVIVLQDPDTLDQLATFPVRIEVAPNPAAGKGISNDYYNYGTMTAFNKAIDDINRLLDDIFAEMESHQKHRGKVVDQEGGFVGCTLPGYYTYSYHDIANIPDAPEGLDSGGLVEVRPGAASDTVFQTIHTANGKEWFRYGANPFEPVFRDKKQVDTLYTALGVINPGTIIQGAPTATGELNKWTTLSVCAEGPVFLGAGVTYSVLMEEGWVYTVMEFDDAQCSTKGTDYYNKSTSPTYTPKKDYGWFRFNKMGADGEYVDITPDDFNASVTFRRSEQSDDGIRSDTPENIGVLNAILNAKQCSQIRYTPIAALPTQKYDGGFPAGEEVQGLPYSSTRLEQLYVPNNVSFYTFMSALQNPKSLLYNVKLDEDYGVDNARTYYGIVCSILTEYALGIKPGYTTALWDKIPGMELIADQSAYGLRLCDVIWRSGHVLLVTDIKRTSDGVIHSIEVTEATAGRDGTVDVINYTLAEFDATFVHGDTEYKFYRYRHIGQVKHTPTAIVPVGGEVATEVTYNTNLMGRLGDRFNVRSGEDVVLDVLDQGAYTQYKVTKDGVALSSAAIPGDGVITLSGLAYGKYSVCLTGSGADSRAVEFIVVDAPPPLVAATANANEYKVDFASSNATPAWVMWFVDNGRKAVVTQIDELAGGEASITTVLQKTSGYARIALETEYGIILSESAVGEYSGAPVEDTEDEGQNPEDNTGSENGGYYIPTVTQTEAGSMTIAFSASQESMPTVAAKNITLPAGPQGEPGDDGYTPVKGTDYWTAADKAEIVAAVIDMLGGNPVFGYVDSNNNIIVSGNLADGSYTVKYEMEDGSMVDIGDLVLDNTVYYAVTNSLTNCVSSNSDTQTAEGGSYYAAISANSGYKLSSVVVTMGGTDVSSTAVSGGTISIAVVTGDIVITAVATEVVSEPSYTNLLPLSVDADGNDFVGAHENGGDGYEYGYKVSASSGDLKSSDAYVSGFIPLADVNDVVRIANIELSGSASINNIVFYDTSKTLVYGTTGTEGAFTTLVKVEDGYIWFFAKSWTSSDIAFFRFSCGGITDETIVTINEEIV